MVMHQNRHSVHHYAAEFENYVGKLTSYDKATLLHIFLCGLDKDLVEEVSMAHPKSLLSAITIAKDLKLAVHFAHCLVVKGGAIALSSGAGT